MATLPTPGGDADTWGTELNTYLSVGHDSGGFPKHLYDSTLASPAASLTLTGMDFTGWTIVRVVAIGRSASGAAGSSNNWERMILRFNNDSGANYLWQVMNTDTNHVDNGTGGYLNGIEFAHVPGSATASAYVGTSYGDIFLPADTTYYKNMISFGELPYLTTGTGLGSITGSTWKNTAAITRIDIVQNEGENFTTGSRIFVIGIA